MAATIKEQVDVLNRNPDNAVGSVVLQVDYQIIEHFSEYLYDSPNKAIEELVANGFDAFATQVNVFTPGPYTADRVIVWDNGASMDVKGLRALWWIAKSPKANGDRIEDRDGTKRKIIGKFGIGKLASYSVGEVISHVCRHDGDYYVVSIDYTDVCGHDGQSPASPQDPFVAPIVRLEPGHAEELVASRFDSAPETLKQMLSSQSWTFAVIERLKVTNLAHGRLMWVLGNGMPLRPDFTIRVNDDTVTSKLEKTPQVELDLGSPEIVEALHSRWTDAVKNGKFDSGLSLQDGRELGLDPSQPDLEVPFVVFPHLGQVWGRIRLFDRTLLAFRAADHGRSHGFFLMVRGRLMNPDDEFPFLSDPSFQSFYRSQFVLHVDHLDSQLLADRQRLRNDEEVLAELRLLQRTVAGMARAKIATRDQRQEESESSHSILPVGSRPYYREPLNALVLKESVDKVDRFDPVAVRVERRPLGEDRQISEVVLEDNAFHVNSLHPYYMAIEKRAGGSRVAREFLRTFDLFAVSERLLEGHLFAIGISDRYVAEIVEWREGLFKRLAASYEAGPKVIEEMYHKSYLGGRAFEKALQDVFADMGFAAEHDGASGKKDVLVMATVGPESYRFVVEAKGSKKPVDNDAANVATAANHRDAVGAQHAVIVAREFSGFGSMSREQSAALYQECAAAGEVSIMEIDALKGIHAAIVRFSYPLGLLRDVFTTLDTPAQKLARIEGLARPVKDFNYKQLLEQIWSSPDHS